MSVITLSPVKSQKIDITLSGDACTLRLTQLPSGLYLDLTRKSMPIVQGVPCLNATRMIRYSWLGFEGDLFFIDTQGDDDPFWSGLGSRWLLFYDDGSSDV